MRVLLLLFLAGLAYGQIIDQAKLNQILETKCNNNARNAYAFEEVKQSFVEFRECVQPKLTRQPPNPIENHLGFCNYLRNSGIYGCVESWTRVVAQCLDDSEKYLPHLFLHAVNSTYDELCGPNGVANSNLIYNKITSTSGCTGLSGLSLSEVECISDLEMLRTVENGMISANKHDFCLNLDKLQSCMKAVVAVICFDDRDAQIIDLMFTPLTEECNDFIHH